MIPTLRFVNTDLRRGRVLKRELLDSAERELRDRNLQDIARINRWCGGHRVLEENYLRKEVRYMTEK